MKNLTLVCTILAVAAVPAYAENPAELAAKHDFYTSFVTDPALGKTSPAEINAVASAESGDFISAQNANDLRLFGVNSPAEIAARR